MYVVGKCKGKVSTHSRLKAAGQFKDVFLNMVQSFNTQPPEGGWTIQVITTCAKGCFNTQPPEGGWLLVGERVSFVGGFNTQPPEGGWFL